MRSLQFEAVGNAHSLPRTSQRHRTMLQGMPCNVNSLIPFPCNWYWYNGKPSSAVFTRSAKCITTKSRRTLALTNRVAGRPCHNPAHILQSKDTENNVLTVVVIKSEDLLVWLKIHWGIKLIFFYPHQTIDGLVFCRPFRSTE